MILSLLIGLSLIFQGQSACDNQCSGHGSCLIDDVCQCYDNWGLGLSHDSGDCSDRICPYEIAWVDTPNKSGKFHKYAECAGRGICNRQTGECECFEGFEGKGCGRMSCPNDCSGHGTCEYIDDLSYGVVWGDYSTNYFKEDPETFPYYFWDTKKARACVCDATYFDVDCSKRMCPYGNDVLDLRDNLLVSAKYQVQQLYFYPTLSGSASDPSFISSQGKTFALVFTSKMNETFTTIPIVYDPEDTSDFALDIKNALVKLPNQVVNDVTVTVSVADSSIGAVQVNITFSGSSVQGPQHLLEVLDFECGNGCTPQLTGLSMETRYYRASPNVTELQGSDYHSFECGRRGKCDYSSGLCNCFLGYTGESCDTLTTLV